MKKQTWIKVLLTFTILPLLLCIGWGDKPRTTDDLLKIAAVGGGLVIDASGKDANDLIKIAALCGSSGGTLYLKHVGNLETMDLIKIAAVGPGHVTIEL